MSDLSLQFSDVYTKISEYLGYGSSPAGTDLTLVKNLVYRAYRDFLRPNREDGTVHSWSFLRKRYYIETTSGQGSYQLPSDYKSVLTAPKFYQGEGTTNPLFVSNPKMDGLLSTNSEQDVPTYFTVENETFGEEVTQKYFLRFWKTPDSSYQYRGWYLFSPQKPTDDTDYFIGGPDASEVILQMSLAVAESQEDEKAGEQTTKANKMLSDLVEHDRNFPACPIIQRDSSLMIDPVITGINKG